MHILCCIVPIKQKQHTLRRYKKMKKIGFLLAGLLFTLALCSLLTVRIVKTVQFEKGCTQYLKRAADANTIELAKQELEKAINYAESHDLTHGTVSIFIQQPANDIGYWYTNMVACYDELENVSEESTQLEKTNILMKLRESLTDETDNGINVTCPNGLDVYPKNATYFWIGIILVLLSSIFYTTAFIAWYNDWD